MRGLFIITTTSETHKHYESFACLPGAEVATYVYNHHLNLGAVGPALDAEIRAAALAFRPDFIVYVGACSGNTPSPRLFRELSHDVAPTVHFCSDAADDPWWPLLAVYEQERAFSLQVSLDGVLPPPIAAGGLAALTPIDPKFYPPAARALPHSERPIILGFAGNVGQRRKRRGLISVDPRLVFVEGMQAFGIAVRQRVGDHTNYREVADHLSRSRMVPNFAGTGSRRYMHVKGRVIEAGLAGALLLEQRGSPTSKWFTPGEDYLEWGTIEEAGAIIARMRPLPEESELMGARLRARISREHSPEVFWRRIFDRIGLAGKAEPEPRRIVESIVPAPPVLAA